MYKHPPAHLFKLALSGEQRYLEFPSGFIWIDLVYLELSIAMESLAARRTRVLTIILFLCSSCRGLPQQSVSESATTLLERGKQAETRGEFLQALSNYNAALQSDSGNAEVKFRIGLVKGRSNDFPGAEAAFRRALQIDPKRPDAHYNLGLTIIADSKNNPDWPRALVEFNAALALRPDYPDAANMVGVGLLETGDAATAVSQFKSALMLNPASAQLHFNLGRALEAAGKSSEAYNEYLTALQYRSAYPEAGNALGNLLFARKEYRAAASQFKAAAASDPDSERAHYGLAKALKAQGESAEALLEFRQASSLIQRQADAIRSSHLSNESLELAKRGDFSEAVRSAREAISLDRQNAIAHYNLGLLLADSASMPSAILELRKAISLAPLQASFYVNLSRMQEGVNDRHGAIESLQVAILLSPAGRLLETRLERLRAAAPSLQQSKASSASGISFPRGAPSDTAGDHFAFATQLSTEGDLPGAIGELLRALTLEPGRGDIRYNLAVAYSETGARDKAELEFRKVLLSSPELVQGHVALGVLLLQNKNHIDAAAEFRQALALRPDDQEVVRLLSKCHTGSTH